MCLFVDVAETKNVKENIKNFQFYKEFRYSLDDDRFESPFQHIEYDLPGTFYEDDAFTKEEILKIRQRENCLIRGQCLHVYCSSKDNKRTYRKGMYSSLQYNSFSCNGNGTVMIDIVVKPQNFIAASYCKNNDTEAVVIEFTVTNHAFKKALKLIRAKLLAYKNRDLDKISNYERITKILK